MLFLSLLGSFEAYIDKRPLTHFSTKKAQALLIYLAVQNQHVHQRESLMTLFWPDSPLKLAQQNLRQALHLMQKTVCLDDNGPQLILSDRYTICLNPREIRVDVAQFEILSTSHCETDWETAVSLYRGEFLAAFFLPDCAPFEEWAAAKRAALQRQAQEVLQRLATHYLENGDLVNAETTIRHQLTLDNLQEGTHRQLLRILAENGRRQEALHHYDTLCELLQDDLAIEPESETISLIDAIRTGELVTTMADSSPQLFKQASEPVGPRHNLPQLLTSFIGREKEMADIPDLLSQNRLVTLTGVGGIGKTTLAIQVGHKILDTFPDGIWLVELAPIADPNLVAQTIAYTLGLWISSNRPILEMLLDFLREKECLIIIDNCEHIIQAVVQFARVSSQTCPQLKILATSREILNVPGEALFYVPPLSIPTNEQWTTIEQWQQYEAIRLFVDRAALVLPGFQVTPENVTPLVQICQRLDGIPLALELAAARVRILTTAQIAARLDNCFCLLTGGSQAVLPRHQTLRTMVDWSWDLLSDTEQILLSRLSVFAGSMSLEAVEAVCVGNDVDTDNLLDLLTALVNKSLVIARQEQGQEARFRLLETIRQFAWERLETTGHANHFRDRHLAYMRQLADRAEQELVRADQAKWMKRLDLELDNMRAALTWARETDVEAGLRIATALWRFWHHGYIREGEAWFTQLLDLQELVTPDVKVKALWMYGRLNYYLYNFEYACALVKESIALSRKLGNQQGLAFGLLNLGVMVDDPVGKQNYELESLRLFDLLEDKLGMAEALIHLGYSESDHEQAVRYLKKSELLYRELGHLGGLANALIIFGQTLIRQGVFDFETVKSMLEESLAIEESLGAKGSGQSLGLLGLMYYRSGMYQQAYDYLMKGLSISQQAGERLYSYWFYSHSGYILLRMGEIGKAYEVFVKSAQQFKEANSISGVAYSMEGLASLATHLGQFERAAKLFAWADTTRENTYDRRPRVEQMDVDRDMGILKERIGEEAVAAAYYEGRRMTMDQILVYVLEKGNADLRKE